MILKILCTSHSRRKWPPRCFDDSLLYQSTGCREELTTSNELKKELYFPVLDAFLMKIDKRFDNKNTEIMKAIQACHPSSRSIPLVKGDGPSFLGRDWLQVVKLNWAQMNLVSSSSPALDKLLDKHAALFQEGLGLLKDVTVKLHVHPDCVPKFHKPHPVPFSRREGVEKELENYRVWE